MLTHVYPTVTACLFVCSCHVYPLAQAYWAFCVGAVNMSGLRFGNRLPTVSLNTHCQHIHLCVICCVHDTQIQVLGWENHAMMTG